MDGIDSMPLSTTRLASPMPDVRVVAVPAIEIMMRDVLPQPLNDERVEMTEFAVWYKLPKSGWVMFERWLYGETADGARSFTYAWPSEPHFDPSKHPLPPRKTSFRIDAPYQLDGYRFSIAPYVPLM